MSTESTPRYSLAQAIERALADRDDTPEECLRTVQSWYGIAPVSPTAVDAWRRARYQHPNDTRPPRGAPVFWQGGSHGYGHIAMSLGEIDGVHKIRSTDADGRGIVGTVPLDWPQRSWGLHYLGWTGDLEDAVIPGLAPSPHAPPAPHPTPQPKPKPRPKPAPHGVPAWPGRPLQLGDSGDSVRVWQLRMRERGFVELAADGQYGPSSATSCRWLQLYLHRTVTGIVDEALWPLTWTEP